MTECVSFPRAHRRREWRPPATVLRAGVPQFRFPHRDSPGSISNSALRTPKSYLGMSIFLPPQASARFHSGAKAVARTGKRLTARRWRLTARRSRLRMTDMLLRARRATLRRGRASVGGRRARLGETSGAAARRRARLGETSGAAARRGACLGETSGAVVRRGSRLIETDASVVRRGERVRETHGSVRGGAGWLMRRAHLSRAE